MRRFTGALLFITLLAGCSAVAIFPRPTKTSSDVPTSPCGPSDLHKKDLDVVIYGASGFVGRQATQYLMEGQVDLPLWAVAGRSASKLESVLEALQHDGTSVEALVAPMSGDMSGLEEIATRARAIVNFAGPFEWHGSENLIIAALSGCAHYVDISTETGWNAQMLETYGELAAQRGVAIVQSAGIASTVADFVAMSAIQEVKLAQGKPPKDVTVLWTKFNDGLSQGQMATAFVQQVRQDAALLDPYILAPKHKMRVDMTVDGFSRYSGYGMDKVMGALTASPMAHSDCPVIRRSTFLTFPDAEIHIREAATDKMGKEREIFLTQAVGHAAGQFMRSRPAPSKDSADGAYPEGEEPIEQQVLSAPQAGVPAFSGGGAPAAMPADMPATDAPAVPATGVPAMPATDFPTMPATAMPLDVPGMPDADAPSMPFLPRARRSRQPMAALQVGAQQVPAAEWAAAAAPAQELPIAWQQEPPMPWPFMPKAQEMQGGAPWPAPAAPPRRGPSDWVLEHGSFTATAIAKSSVFFQPGTVEGHVTLQGSGDPYFRGSARIATEVALGLALHGTNTKAGGYLTPSTALGVEQLERRLKLVDEGAFVKTTHYHYTKTDGKP